MQFTTLFSKQIAVILEQPFKDLLGKRKRTLSASSFNIIDIFIVSRACLTTRNHYLKVHNITVIKQMLVNFSTRIIDLPNCHDFSLSLTHSEFFGLNIFVKLQFCLFS